MLEGEKSEVGYMHILGIILHLIYFCSGNDKQKIGAYLSSLNKYQIKNIYVDWTVTASHKCDEGDWIECIENTLGYHPKYNFKKGDSC
jgi:hypothetical protein